MKKILSWCYRMDALSEWIGRSVCWLLLLAVVISSGNAIMRKAFDVGSNAFLEAQWYLFAALYLLGAGYVFLHDQHVRIDVLASRLSRKARNWIDVIGIGVFLLPLCIFVAWSAWPSLMVAIDTKEVSTNPGGLIRWPLYALVPLGFMLLFLQSLSELFKRIAFLTGDGPDPHAVKEQTDEEKLLEELRHELDEAQGSTTQNASHPDLATTPTAGGRP